MKHLVIITGASRGMGRAIAEQLIDRGDRVLALSRHTVEAMQAQAQNKHVQLEQWAVDLSHGEEVSGRLRSWLQGLTAKDYTSITLINNAASLSGLGPLGEAEPADLAVGIRVGLEAPMQLTAVFLGATSAWTIPRKVLNISSGLGRRAMASSANYCAIKAGMDHFTRCVALEEALKPNGAKVCSLAPGVIATDMQVQLRSVPEDKFPDVGNFRAMHEKGMLASPEDAARSILTFLARPDFGSNPVADIRD